MKFFSCFAELSKFEKLLWIVSVLSLIISFIYFSNNSYLVLFASLVGVTALVFVAKGFVVGQVLTVVFSIMYGIISFCFRYYGEMITYVGMTMPMAVLSIISWHKNPFRDGEKEVKVNIIGKKVIIYGIIFSVLTTIIFYFILSYFNTENIFFSTFSITTSFAASYLTFFRSEFYALAYSANDVILVILWVSAAMQNQKYCPMVVCFVMFLCNDIYGYYNWNRLKVKQQKNID